MSITLAQALAQARARGLDRLDAQLLLAHLLDRPRTWLLAHDDDPLADGQAQRFDAACAERARGVPLAYLVGEREFHGLTLAVGPGVLVPRPDTETLVDWGLDLLHGPLAGVARPDVVDLGTGSGAIALALAHRCPHARVRATDLSEPALAMAQANAQRLGLAVAFDRGDWWAALGDARFDLALSNPPYVAGDDPHLAALVDEPLQALTPGGDGLAAIEAIIAGAPQHLRTGGWLLLEHGWDQADAVAARLRDAGFEASAHRTDLQGHRRCTGGQWSGARPAATRHIR